MRLTFGALRNVNVTRCKESFHPLADWSPTDWACALGGECGEALNAVKKLRRLDGAPRDTTFEREWWHREIANELADVVIYADLLAARLHIDLGDAIVKKFNETSAKVGSIVSLPRQEDTE